MKSINEQINPEFVIQAKKLAAFSRLLRRVLPPECHGHVEVANIRDQNLMLIADSPVWTTKLRQLSPQILQFIQSNTAGDTNGAQIIHHIQISTRYHAPDSSEQQALIKKNRHKKVQISEKTAAMLSQSANSIEHQQLKAALLRIASHVNKQNKPEK